MKSHIFEKSKQTAEIKQEIQKYIFKISSLKKSVRMQEKNPGDFIFLLATLK